MSSVKTTSTMDKSIRSVWKSTQMYIAFHKDQNKRQSRKKELKEKSRYRVMRLTSST